MSPTGTRVRRNTASMISLWLKLGTMTPSFSVYPPTIRLAGTRRLKTGVASGRKLMDELFGCGAAIERALVGLFQNHDAAALNALVV